MGNVNQPPSPDSDENGVEDGYDPAERAKLHKAMNPHRTPEDIERLRQFAKTSTKPPRMLKKPPPPGDSPHVTLDEVIDAFGYSRAELEAELDAPRSPQMARSIAATENAWDAIDAEFGLLSDREVGDLLGDTTSASRNLASGLHAKGRLLRVKRGNTYRYPGFQFTNGKPLPIVARLRSIAGETGCREGDVILWLTAPTGWLSDKRPVDLLTSEPERVLKAVKSSFSVEW